MIERIKQYKPILPSAINDEVNRLRLANHTENTSALTTLCEEYEKLYASYVALQNVYSGMLDDFGKSNEELIEVNKLIADENIDKNIDKIKEYYYDAVEFFRMVRKNKLIDALIFADKKDLLYRSRKGKLL